MNQQCVFQLVSSSSSSAAFIPVSAVPGILSGTPLYGVYDQLLAPQQQSDPTVSSQLQPSPKTTPQQQHAKKQAPTESPARWSADCSYSHTSSTGDKGLQDSAIPQPATSINRGGRPRFERRSLEAHTSPSGALTPTTLSGQHGSQVMSLSNLVNRTDMTGA